MFARWGVRGLHLNVEGWGGGSRISVLERVWMNWDCLCSRGAAGSGEKSSVRSEETCETWGQRWGDSTSDLHCHISFICFWQTSHLIFISPQQSLVLDFPYCVHLFFWDPARRVRYGTSLTCFREAYQTCFYALHVYIRCRKCRGGESF